MAEAQNLGTVSNPIDAYPTDIQLLIESGTIWPGDAILVKGRGDTLRWLIRRAQSRLLADLIDDGGWNTKRAAARLIGLYAGFTHARVVLDEFLFGEMYRPRARCDNWHSIPKGTVLLFRRSTRIHSPAHSEDISEACQDDIDAHVGYGTRELFYYWFTSLGFRKLVLGRKFCDLFREKRADVCSGRYIHWLHCADVMLDEMPEAWYPARIAWSNVEFNDIACLRVA